MAWFCLLRAVKLSKAGLGIGDGDFRGCHLLTTSGRIEYQTFQPLVQADTGPNYSISHLLLQNKNPCMLNATVQHDG